MELLRRGVQVVTICTDRFIALAEAEAAALGQENPALVSIEHPLGGLRPEQLADRTAAALEGVRAWLEGLVPAKGVEA
ncbi:MAG: hypothetical protein IRY95_05955 [Clostridia bacterium]|nr:hypothetical protein [Clostridia bacterium]